MPLLALQRAGTLLGAAQLNAAANVPGTVVYGPAAGTAATAGAQTLPATLTPTGSTNDTTATARVSMVVTASGGGFVGPGYGDTHLKNVLLLTGVDGLMGRCLPYCMHPGRSTSRS